MRWVLLSCANIGSNVRKVRVHALMCVCVCVCVCKTDKQTERCVCVLKECVQEGEKEIEKDIQTERCVWGGGGE